jgi:8-oxo-dGTP diphosphatase
MRPISEANADRPSAGPREAPATRRTRREEEAQRTTNPPLGTATTSDRSGGPVVTIDVVVLRMGAGEIEVVAVTRRREPFLGCQALPGAYVLAGETLIDACRRCMTTKAGLAHPMQMGLVGEPRQFLAADSVARDPRGHAVSIVHLALVGPNVELANGEQPAWLAIDKINHLAFDHAEVVAAARRFLVNCLWSDAEAFTRLAGTRPLTTPLLREIAEAAVGHALDHANFSRRLGASGLFLTTEAAPTLFTHRPRGRGRPPTVWAPQSADRE